MTKTQEHAPATDGPWTDQDIADNFAEATKGLGKTGVHGVEESAITGTVYSWSELAEIDSAIIDQVRTDAPPAPFVYRTATTDAARELISKRDMLQTLVREDEGELTYLEEQYQQQLRQLNEAHAEARSIVEARRNDRQRAADAFAAVIDGLQENNNGK